VAQRVPGGALERVGERVPQVEVGANAGLQRVRADDVGLHADAVGHEPRPGGGGEVGRQTHGRCGEAERVAPRRVDQQRVLVELDRPLAQHGRRQRAERPDVGDDHPGLPEGADEVLAGREVEAGLAADGGVHHGEQGGRHLHERDAAQPRGRDEAGEVADHAAAHGAHPRVAVAGGRRQAGVQIGPRGHRLAAFAGRHLEQQGLHAERAPRLGDPLRMAGRGHVGVGHDRRARRPTCADVGHGMGKEVGAGADPDVVARIQRHAHPRGGDRRGAHPFRSFQARSFSTISATTSADSRPSEATLMLAASS
jgi:hypothetical protein